MHGWLTGNDSSTITQEEGFADTILNRAPMLGATVHDGVQNMRAMVAIARSVEIGGKVKLSDVTGAV